MSLYRGDAVECTHKRKEQLCTNVKKKKKGVYDKGEQKPWHTNLKKLVARRSGRGGVLPETVILVSLRVPVAVSVVSVSSSRFEVLDARISREAMISVRAALDDNGFVSDSC